MGETRVRTPATVITGFLGAGKTTLIRHLLANADGKRIALIVNEFGDVGVDGDTLRGCGDAACAEEDVVELANGCICCTVADDFVPTMTMLLDRDAPPDHIVIETSGLALPQPLVRAFNWPEIRDRVTVDGVVAVVDAAALAEGRFAIDEAALEAQRAADDGLDHETPIAELFDDQLACADLIVLSKADLVDAPTQDRLESSLRDRTRPGVGLMRAEQGAAPAAALIGMGVGAEGDLAARGEVHHRHHDDDRHDHAGGHDHVHDHGHDDHGRHDHHHHHHDHGHDAFESFVVALPSVRVREKLEDRLAAALSAVGALRAKGFAAVDGKPMRLAIQAVGPRVSCAFDRAFAPNEPRDGNLVVIGLQGMDRERAERALRAAAAGDAP